LETLADRDLKRLQNFLEQTSEPRDIASFIEGTLPAINELIGGDVICHAEVDPAGAKLVSQTVYAGGDVPDNPAYVREAFERLMFTSPLFDYWTSTGEMTAIRTSQFLGRRQWHETPLYQEVYKTWRTEDSLAIPLPAPAGLVACFCIERSRAFDNREQMLMNLAMPHLALAYRNAEALSMLKDAGTSSGMHSILLDSRCRIVQASEGALELLERCFADDAGFPNLPATLEAWVRRRLSRFDNGSMELDAPLVVEGTNGSSISIRLLKGTATGSQSLLILKEGRPDNAATFERFGLSVREMEVMCEVLRGLSSSGIAEALVISRRTVEKHLESIYNKLGVESRGAAIAKVLATGPD
jgi:DNA-binding CsgD family transcriptional regulator